VADTQDTALSTELPPAPAAPPIRQVVPFQTSDTGLAPPPEPATWPTVMQNPATGQDTDWSTAAPPLPGCGAWLSDQTPFLLVSISTRALSPCRRKTPTAAQVLAVAQDTEWNRENFACGTGTDWTDQPPFAAGAAEARAAAGARATARPAAAASWASRIPDLRIIVTLCLFAPGQAVARSGGKPGDADQPSG
jgi:hypothetical protein